MWRLWPFASSKITNAELNDASALTSVTKGKADVGTTTNDSADDQPGHVDEKKSSSSTVHVGEDSLAIDNDGAMEKTGVTQIDPKTPLADVDANLAVDGDVQEQEVMDPEGHALIDIKSPDIIPNMGRLSSQRSHRTRRRKMNRVYLPPQDKLQGLPLREGQNLITFQCESSVWGTQTVQGYLYMYVLSSRVGCSVPSL